MSYFFNYSNSMIIDVILSEIAAYFNREGIEL